MGENVNEDVEYVYDDSKDLLTQCIINQLNNVRVKQESFQALDEDDIKNVVELYKLKNEADKIEISKQNKTDDESIERKKQELEEKKVENEAKKEERNSRDRLIGIAVDIGVPIITTIIGFAFYSKLDNRHLMYDKDGTLISKETQNILGKSLPSLFKKK